MGKKPMTAGEQNASKHWYPKLFEMRERTFAGFLYDSAEKNTFDDSPEEREAFYQSLWDSAGFYFWLANYKDLLTDGEANTQAYNFWAKKVRARIGDPKKRDILAPLKMPHYFGIKRPCLEQNYYDQFNRETVDVVDVNKNPIKEIDETGILLEDGTHYDLDFIAVATGFVRLSYFFPPLSPSRSIANNIPRYTPTGYHHRWYDANGSQVGELDGAGLGMASRSQHVLGYDCFGLPKHVPHVRTSRPNSFVKRAFDRRGPGAVDRGHHYQDPKKRYQVCERDARGDQGLETEH